PFITQAVKSGKGKVSFSSKDVPGLIADTQIIHQKVIDEQPEEVQKLVNVWHQVLDFREKSPEAAYAIEAKRAGVSVADYKTLQQGLEWLTPQQTLENFQPGNTTRSLAHAGEIVADFMLKQKLISTKPPATNELIDDRFMKAYVAKATT
ncbi:MAG: hypothetical protein WCD18_03410, partial [Thermosynechococcaceae cyanobacterium]